MAEAYVNYDNFLRSPRWTKFNYRVGHEKKNRDVTLLPY